MTRASAALRLAAPVVLVALAAASWAQDFYRLSGTQIRTTVIGKRVTDDTHWSQTVAAGRKLLVRNMGHVPMGPWQIRDDRLCIARPGILQDYHKYGSLATRSSFAARTLPYR